LKHPAAELADERIMHNQYLKSIVTFTYMCHRINRL